MSKYNKFSELSEPDKDTCTEASESNAVSDITYHAETATFHYQHQQELDIHLLVGLVQMVQHHKKQ